MRELGEAGRALWDAVHADLGAEWELTGHERVLLEQACAQLDVAADLDAEVEARGLVVTGSRDQPVLLPAVTEARLARLAAGRLLGALKLPDADGQPSSAGSRRSRDAARVRWSKTL